MLTARASLSIDRRERYKKREYYYSTILYEDTLWRKQNIPVKIWNQDDFRIYLWSKFGIKLENYINTKWNNDVVIFSNNVCRDSQSDIDKQ